MVSVLGRFFAVGRGSALLPFAPLLPLLVGAVPFAVAGGVSWDISRSVPED